MIVVDHDDHVRPGLGHPLLGRLIPLEQGRPIGFARLAVVDGGANGGRVRRADACDDLRHQLSPRSDLERQRSGERPPATIMSTYSFSVMPVICDAMN